MTNPIIQATKAQTDQILSNIPGYIFIKTIQPHIAGTYKSRAEEFISFIEENEQFFTSTIINNEVFISGLGLAYTEFIKQHSELKRYKILSILKGFATSEAKNDFELERMLHILNIISIDQIKLLPSVVATGYMPYTEEPDEEFIKKENDLYALVSLGIAKKVERGVITNARNRRGKNCLKYPNEMKNLSNEDMTDIYDFLDLNNLIPVIMKNEYDLTDFGERFTEFVTGTKPIYRG